jgi:hypothetical protein
VREYVLKPPDRRTSRKARHCTSEQGDRPRLLDGPITSEHKSGSVPGFYSPVGVIRICGLFLGVSTRGQVKARVMSKQAQVDALEHLLSIIKSSEVSIAAYETFENAQAITDD